MPDPQPAVASSPWPGGRSSAQVQAQLDALVAQLRPERGGELPGYIPELANVDGDACALAVCSADGELLLAGDHAQAFSLQSMSKPFVYAQALELLGREAVHRKVDVEPTGEAFNSIVELEEDHLPYNPMINSGAIAMSALLHHADPDGAWARLRGMFSQLAGRALHIRGGIARSELSASHRNRAIAWLLRHFEVIGDDIDGALLLYTGQCALMVEVADLAVMAATLARGGVQPRTGERVLSAAHARDVLALMTTCGMYDSSGRWAYEVGIPAKSGVSGGILAVVPGRLGLAAWSPRLDAHGHSLRGQAALRALAQDWGLSLFTV